MLFDDRLGTVLRLSASGTAVRLIQYRQLLDLLGISPAEARGDQLDAAYVRLAELAEKIPASDRARAIGDAGLRLRSPRLVAALAEGEPTVAAAALRHAHLAPDQWLDLVPALHPSARPYLRQRRDLPAEVVMLLTQLGVTGPGLPPAQVNANLTDDEGLGEDLSQGGMTEDAAPLSPTDNGIGAIVKRIEAYRRARSEPGGSSDSPRLPLGEDHVFNVAEEVRAFDFATDADLAITWSDPGVAAMVTGLRLSTFATGTDFETLARRHQPLVSQPLQLVGAGAIAGEWVLDAAAWFDPIAGRFLGYRGRMRRPASCTAQLASPRESQADRMRQMLHELRTPVNAIQGFAEVIQQQLFGPTPHEYRAVAAEIAGDAARILSGFEELDRLAKLDSGALALDSGTTDLIAVLEPTIAQLAAHTAQRGSGFSLRIKGDPQPLGLDRGEVERLVWRVLATLAGASGSGEILKIAMQPTSTGVQLDLALPAVLAGTPGESLFETAPGAIPQSLSAGMFGVGFALRLARAEARAAGGDLTRDGNALCLALPTSAETGLSRPDAGIG